MQTGRTGTRAPNHAIMGEVNSQISAVAIKPAQKLEKFQGSMPAVWYTQTMKRSKRKNKCQGKGDKWSQTHLYQPFKDKSVGSATSKQRGARAGRLPLPVSLRSARHCLLPFPRAAFLLISSSWLSSSMAGHGNPCRAAPTAAGQAPGWHRAPHTSAQTCVGEGTLLSCTLLSEQFARSQFRGGYSCCPVRFHSPAELDETRSLWKSVQARDSALPWAPGWQQKV